MYHEVHCFEVINENSNDSNKKEENGELKMPKRVLDTSKVNQTRMKYINKGYLTRGEVAKFVPCGSVKASKIYHQIRNQVEVEGLENCFNVILVQRLLDFMGLTVKQVKEAAKNEVS